jgi:hypothetical protein
VNPEAIGEVFQITSDEVLTWDQIHLEAYQALGLEPNLIHIPELIAAYWPHAVGSLIGDNPTVLLLTTANQALVPKFVCDVDWAEDCVCWRGTRHTQVQDSDKESTRFYDTIVAARSAPIRPGADMPQCFRSKKPMKH